MKIGYARVSTIDQTPRAQIDALETAGCEKIFSEHASGKSNNRPKLDAALNYLREGDTLVVWKLSRLARSLSQIIKISNSLSERGINLKVITEKFDTTTPEGKLFFHIIASFDEFQREVIRENTRAGLAAAHKRGRKGGRRPVKPEVLKNAETMLKDRLNYPFVADVIDALPMGRTSFYAYFPPEKIREIRKTHDEFEYPERD